MIRIIVLLALLTTTSYAQLCVQSDGTTYSPCHTSNSGFGGGGYISPPQFQGRAHDSLSGGGMQAAYDLIRGNAIFDHNSQQARGYASQVSRYASQELTNQINKAFVQGKPEEADKILEKNRKAIEEATRHCENAFPTIKDNPNTIGYPQWVECATHLNQAKDSQNRATQRLNELKEQRRRKTEKLERVNQAANKASCAINDNPNVYPNTAEFIEQQISHVKGLAARGSAENNEALLDQAEATLRTINSYDLAEKTIADLGQSTKVIDLRSIPDVPVSYPFTSTGEFRESLTRLHQDLSKINPKLTPQKEARDLGLIAVEEADSAFTAGDKEQAEFFKELAKESLDIAIGLHPVTGFAQSVYELGTGKSLVKGTKLTGSERALAFLGVATFGGSKFITQAGKGMWKIFERASHLIKDRQAAELAIREGEKLLENAGSVLTRWSKKHKITHIETAADANGRMAKIGLDKPPYLPESYIVHFETIADSKFARVHLGTNEARNWLIKAGEIRGLTPVQIQEKLNLPYIPSHISEVLVPKGTKMTRGITNFNQWEKWESPFKLSGQVQYRIETEIVPSTWFSGMREIGERYL